MLIRERRSQNTYPGASDQALGWCSTHLHCIHTCMHTYIHTWFLLSCYRIWLYHGVTLKHGIFFLFLLNPAMTNVICLKSHICIIISIHQLIWNNSRALPFVSIILQLIIKLVIFLGYDQPLHPQQVRSYNIKQCLNLFIAWKDGALGETSFQSLKSNKPNRKANLHHRFLVSDGCYIRVFHLNTLTKSKKYNPPVS